MELWQVEYFNIMNKCIECGIKAPLYSPMEQSEFHPLCYDCLLNWAQGTEKIKTPYYEKNTT